MSDEKADASGSAIVGHLWTVFAFLAGLLLMALCAVRTFHLGPIDLGSLGTTLGEGLVAAGLLAFLVDRRLKLDLAREISRKTAGVFFREFLGGRYLPDEYYTSMRKLAAADVLSLGVAWHLHLAWADESDPTTGRRYLRVTSTVHNTFVNTGSRSQPHAVTWLMFQRDGRPPSRLTRCELTVISDDRRETDRVGEMHRAVLTQAQLDEVNGRIERNVKDPDVGVQLPEIQAGATAVLCASGTIFHSATAIMPLICRYPTLRQELTVSGPALRDLELSVFSGARTLPPAAAESGPACTSRRYHEDGLVLSGSTMRVEWVPVDRAGWTGAGDASQIPAQPNPNA